jgi:hypothetical protein
MLATWLKASQSKTSFGSFAVINAKEIKVPDDAILDYLGEATLTSYREISHLKRDFSGKTKKELKDHLIKMVFPPKKDSFNVRQGDFGEILARLFIEKFSPGMIVPCYKLRWKFNNSKAVFCTDIFAHNIGSTITDLKYYEVKTKITNTKTSIEINGKSQSRHVGVVAHEGLARDENKISNEFVADFIKRLYQNKAQVLEDAGLLAEAKTNWDIASQYNDIVSYPSKYKRSFELVLIIESSKYSPDVLKDLQSLPPTLAPLDVTIILIDGLKDLVHTSIDRAIKVSIKKVYGK